MEAMKMRRQKGNTVSEQSTQPKVAVGYAIGEVGCSVSWYMVNNYLTLFYTDVVGLSATAISLIMLIARVWDAINDPMMGNIADRTNTRWGRFRPYLMFAPPFLAVFNFLTFTVWPLTGAAKVIVCMLCYILVGMAYTAVGIAQSAIVNVLALDTQDRMNLSTARGIGASIANMALSAIAMPTILWFSGAEVANKTGYMWFSVVMGVAMIICFCVESYLCPEKYTQQLHAQTAESSERKKGFLKSFASICKNDQLMLIVVMVLIGTICITARMSLLSYYLIYVLGSYNLISPVFTLLTTAQLIGTLTIPFMTKRMGKRNYMILLNALMVLGMICTYFWGKNLAVLYAFCIIGGLNNCSSTLCYGMISDSIEYGAWKLHTRQEALAGAMLSFAVKCATAISGAVGVLLLMRFGYVPNAEQTEAAKQGINFVVNMIPAFLGIITFIPMFMYKLTEQRVTEIRAQMSSQQEEIS